MVSTITDDDDSCFGFPHRGTIIQRNLSRHHLDPRRIWFIEIAFQISLVRSICLCVGGFRYSVESSDFFDSDFVRQTRWKYWTVKPFSFVFFSCRRLIIETKKCEWNTNPKKSDENEELFQYGARKINFNPRRNVKIAPNWFIKS